MTLVASILDGNRLALSRLLSQIENGHPQGRLALQELFPYTGRAHRIGVTGAPGTGKSSLVNALAHHYRQANPGEVARRVAIIAVDPSSPFTGGAILGDRIRMKDLAGDPGVFIRSMAARGSLGGLAAATADVAQVFDAAGFELILIETVGAGQAEVDIARLAHTTLVVEAPGLGDDIQAIKAGILEIADVLVVNKADRPGVESTERALRNMLELAHPANRLAFHHSSLFSLPLDEDRSSAVDAAWIPPIQRTVSIEGAGIVELAAHVERHKQYLLKTGEWLRRERLRLQAEVDRLILENLVSRWRSGLAERDYGEILEAVVNRRISPYEAVERLTAGIS